MTILRHLCVSSMISAQYFYKGFSPAPLFHLVAVGESWEYRAPIQSLRLLQKDVYLSGPRQARQPRVQFHAFYWLGHLQVRAQNCVQSHRRLCPLGYAYVEVQLLPDLQSQKDPQVIREAIQKKQLPVEKLNSYAKSFKIPTLVSNERRFAQNKLY